MTKRDLIAQEIIEYGVFPDSDKLKKNIQAINIWVLQAQRLFKNFLIVFQLME